MISNYHTHTWRCNHASDTERDYVLAALERGMEILGFSDHAPYFFPNGYYSRFRMRPEQLKGYCSTIFELRKEFAGRIQIPLGLEIEYYPALLPELIPFLRDNGVEYLLLGQHFLGNEMDDTYSGGPTSDVSRLKRYCAQTVDAMHTGLFSYFAHPDLMDFRGSDREYRNCIRRICSEARACNVPLEINLLGLREGRCYPDVRFWEVAAEECCEVILGVDAHASENLLDVKVEQTAMELVRRFGLKLVETVQLKKI